MISFFQRRDVGFSDAPGRYTTTSLGDARLEEVKSFKYLDHGSTQRVPDRELEQCQLVKDLGILLIEKCCSLHSITEEARGLMFSR